MKRWFLSLAFGVAFQGMFCVLWAASIEHIIVKPGPRENITKFVSEKELAEALSIWEKSDASILPVQFDDEKAMFICCDCSRGSLKAYRMVRCRVQEREAVAGKTRDVLQRCTEKGMDTFTQDVFGNSKCDGCFRTPQVRERVGTRKRKIRTLEQIEKIDREREQEFKLREQQERAKSQQRREADPRWQKEQEKKRKNKEKNEQWLQEQNRAFEERQRRMEERLRRNN